MWNFGQWEEEEGRRVSTSDADAERDITFREMLEELRAQTRQNADILAVMQRQWRVIAEDQYNLREIRNQNGQILKAIQGQVSALRKELLELKNSSKAQIHSQYAQHIRTKGALSNTDKQRVIILAESYGWSGTKKSKNMTSHDIGVNWISALEALETSSLPNLSHDNGLLRSSNDNARG